MTVFNRRRVAKAEVNAKLDEMLAARLPEPYACARCLTVYESDQDACPYCNTPTGEPADDEGDD